MFLVLIIKLLLELGCLCNIGRSIFPRCTKTNNNDNRYYYYGITTSTFTTTMTTTTTTTTDLGLVVLCSLRRSFPQCTRTGYHRLYPRMHAAPRWRSTDRALAPSTSSHDIRFCLANRPDSNDHDNNDSEQSSLAKGEIVMVSPPNCLFMFDR